jgi:hypothetical protein
MQMTLTDVEETERNIRARDTHTHTHTHTHKHTHTHTHIHTHSMGAEEAAWATIDPYTIYPYTTCMHI